MKILDTVFNVLTKVINVVKFLEEVWKTFKIIKFSLELQLLLKRICFYFYEHNE